METLVRNSPIILVVLGVASWLISTTIDGGFFHGLFQGAAVALVILGVYLLFSLRRKPEREHGMWLPSREDADETRHAR